MTTSWLPYWPVTPQEVSSSAWPFVYHLNEISRRIDYYDRIWSRLQWVHPTKRELIRTPELEKLNSLGHGNQQLIEAFHFARARRDSDELFLLLALSDALALVAPKLFNERVILFGEIMASDGEDWNIPVNVNRTKKIEITGYLFCVEGITSLLAKRDLELGKLREGHYLALWKADAQKLGAIRGGRRSAETRQANRRTNPEKIVNDANMLLSSGKSARSITSILAARSGVTADHIRKIIRKTKKQD